MKKEIIIDKIMNDPKAGVNNIKEQFGILYFVGGQKSKMMKGILFPKKRHTLKNKNI